MANIYANSTITIAASASSDSHQGLFRVADPECVGRLLSSDYPIHVRKPLDHRTTRLPLLQRGWVFQESLLSPRIIHFAHDELLWECAECRDCECEGITEEPFGWTEKPLLPKKDYYEVSRRWKILVSRYSGLKLSKPSDIFPAISGIAKSFGEATGWEYLAGMWKETLIQDLLWYKNRPGTRCVPWRAPTFSWASVASRIYHKPLRNPVNVATVLGARCYLVGEDPTGQLERGFVVLSGVLIRATLRYTERNAQGYEDSEEGPKQNAYIAEILPSDGGLTDQHVFWPDFKQAGVEVDDCKTVFCLKMVQAKGQLTCLVLSQRPSTSWEYDGLRGDCEFERVGLMVDTDDTLKAPQHAIEHNAIVKII
jgi:hypothetical protein